jgi:hypothetical protein
MKEDSAMTPTSKKDNASAQLDKAKDQASAGWDKTKDAASTAADKAKDAASHVGQAVSHAASAVGQKAEDATASVGQGIQHLGDRVKQSGPHSGMLGRATDTVADALKDTGRYLEDKNLSGLAEDVTQLIRRNPIPALLLGVGIGFLLARTLRS